MKLIPFRVISLICTALVLSAAVGSVAEGPPAVTPIELVRRAVANEMKSDEQPVKYMFRQRKETPSGSQTRLMVETRDALAGLLVAYNDQPLNQEQRQGEYDRLERFLRDPEELARKRKQEKENSERVKSILRALPDAFLYEYNGSDTGKPGVGELGSKLVRLKFRPNPKYSPPTRVEQVLTGMEGTVLIDPQKEHIAAIDGTLAKEVGFGWGILGHLDRGGHFLVNQTSIGGDNWSIARMDLAFTGKLLLFKSLNFKSTEVYSDFRPAPPDLTFAQGVELLKKQEATVAINRNGSGK
ncbi:MAG: hypothetical protein WB755_08060 [Terriglobales bacterium]